MPSSEQVAETILQMQHAIAWINIGVLANIFMILEILGGIANITGNCPS